MRRRRMSRRASGRNFRRGSKVRGKNWKRSKPMRGGFRI